MSLIKSCSRLEIELRARISRILDTVRNKPRKSKKPNPRNNKMNPSWINGAPKSNKLLKRDNNHHGASLLKWPWTRDNK